MIFRTFACFVILTQTVWAEEYFPRLFDIPDGHSVVVFDAPKTNANIVSSLTSVNGAIEALQIHDDWVEISSPQGRAWVQAKELIARDVPDIVPNEFSCIGSEPTWLLERRDGSIFVDLLEGYILAFDAAKVDLNKGLLEAFSPDGALTLVLKRERCSVSLGDFNYGLSVSATIPDFSRTHQFNGCCSLKP